MPIFLTALGAYKPYVVREIHNLLWLYLRIPW